ncbi:MAG: low specificity L-threonine aldolase [Bacteroidia bacterium]
MTIDLRSDTLTLPTAEMKAAMMDAPLGDDVWGEDPSVNALQDKMAELFGVSAALFCPSGTMCNQIAIKLSTRPQDQVICDETAHIYLYEGGGIAANSLASVKLLQGDRGRLDVDMVRAAVNPRDQHFPRSSLVALENTSNKGGGSCYKLSQIANISMFCREQGLRLHLDGARLFNALVATGDSPREYGKYFDSISICLSKGLGAPVGSVLLLREEERFDAMRIRKLMGGGMRQAGMLAAAGMYALDHHVERLAEDHAHAAIIGKILADCNWVLDVLPVETNIICFQPNPEHFDVDQVLFRLREKNILAAPFGEGYIRFVTHLNVSGEMIERLGGALLAF